MREHRVIAICLGAAGLIATALLFARAETVSSSAAAQPSPSPRPNSINESESSQSAQLVQKIRQQIGSPLDGSVFESAASQPQVIPTEPCAAPLPVEFDKIYEEVVRASDLSVDEPWHCAAPQSCELTAEGYAVPDPRAQAQQSLRDAARELEATAADLEEGGAYDDADGLRRWARRLRADARR